MAWVAIPVGAVLLAPAPTANAALLGLAASLGGGLAVGAALYPALRLERRRRAAVLSLGMAAIAASPLLIPGDARLARFVAAVFAAVLVVKLFDVHVGATRGRVLGRGAYLAFLPNFFSWVERRLERERPAGERTRRRLAAALVQLAAGTALLGLAVGTDWEGRPFLLEHAAKATGLGISFFGLAATVVQLARLGGARVRDFTDAPLLARTPAEFWRRYNRLAQQFFYDDVFKPAGGLRAPARATLLAFAISGALHEYIFGVALGRVEGYQLAFFLVNGVAVAATARVRPRGLLAGPATAATLAFILLSSVLFFASFDGVSGFYSGRLPWSD